MKKSHINFSKPSLQQLNVLLKSYQNRKFIEAEKSAILITQEFPKHQFAWKVLAAVYRQTGKIKESLAISQSGFQPHARGIIWDLRELSNRKIKPLDMNQKLKTHFNTELIIKEFREDYWYPDQELIGFWTDGVQWKVDVDLQNCTSATLGFSS